MLKKFLPRFKKKISSFLSEEDGRISKQSLLAISAFLATGALSTIFSATSVKASVTHSNDLSLTHSGANAVGIHQHHSSHSSHASHASHGTHSSHASHASHGTHSSGI